MNAPKPIRGTALRLVVAASAVCAAWSGVAATGPDQPQSNSSQAKSSPRGYGAVNGRFTVDDRLITIPVIPFAGFAPHDAESTSTSPRCRIASIASTLPYQNVDPTSS
jgi:hypothetical protein